MNTHPHSSLLSRPRASCGWVVKGADSAKKSKQIDTCPALDKPGATATFGEPVMNGATLINYHCVTL